jgi:hypothetical protein
VPMRPILASRIASVAPGAAIVQSIHDRLIVARNWARRLAEDEARS